MLKKKTPETLAEWLTDVQDAYQFACRQFYAGSFQISTITDLFKSAASVAAERRNISATEIIQEMTDYVQEQIESDLAHGAELADYKFNFVISYVHSHTPAGILDELEADAVMDYVNDRWDLFDERV